ncbi:hypothetical protein Arub01_46850 [Actinomadura rubrobrunea]|uniref:Potassium/proton antiporter subunit KhtT-like N-terminal domain-containing protein n=1 Tax=Actinomadura rubrobrunea TaxID=115335 RepID=A0A9W6Q0S8_9ACTN|nr:hypothetical protein [Actinomadura rubrobrunea]GLW66441.1 hypothetical protein Arub01_46850 [Actinomadura rubrobrunea]
MHVTPTTVPGSGTLYHILTRRGKRLALFIDTRGERTLYVYGPASPVDPDQGADPDRPAHSIVLDRDEADQLAQLLHERSVDDRIAALERRLDELTASGGTGRPPP